MPAGREPTLRYRLHYNALSPFARRVIVAALECELPGVELVSVDVWGRDGIAGNPLGKVPTLVTPDGPLCGSLQICLYIDGLLPAPRLLPAEARWQTLQLAGLGEGLMEAAVAHVVERLRRPPGLVWPGWLERQERKVAGALDALAPMPLPDRADLGAITLGCALSYLDIRLSEVDWRARAPRLADWHGEFARRRSMRATDWLIAAREVAPSMPLSELPR